MKNLRILFVGIAITACMACAGGPAVVPGLGAVYGTVTAESHKALVEKAAKEETIYSEQGTIVYSKDMVNYPQLQELYVGLIGSDVPSGGEHFIEVRDSAMSVMSLALARGDAIRLRNNTLQTQNFYIVDAQEGIQLFPTLKPGQEAAVQVNGEGLLELLSEENERLITLLLSRSGMGVRQVASGGSYAFERLNPGNYNLIFWFWRLGWIEKKISVEAGKNIRVNQVLSVDKVLMSTNEP